MKESVRSAVVPMTIALCLGLSGRVTAADIDAPWAHWEAAEDAYTDITDKLESKWACTDATGHGHVLKCGNQVTLGGTVNGRENVFACEGWGPGWMTFERPALESCTFSAWVRFPLGNLNHYETESAKLIYLLHDLSGLSVSLTKENTIPQDRTSVTLKLEIGDNECLVTAGAGRLLRRKWHHVAVTLNRTAATTADIALYVNGTRAFEWQGVTVPAATVGLTCIGNANTEARSNWGNSLTARFADISVYDAALSASEVAALYATENDKPWLVGHWTMDRIDTDGAGKRTTPDVSGSGNDLEIGSLESLTDGITGSALRFDGVTDGAADAPAVDSFARFTNQDLAMNGEFTLAMWVKKASNQVTADGGRLFKPGNSAYIDFFCDDTAASTKASIFLQYYQGRYNVTTPLTAFLLRADEWTHSVLTCRYAAGDRPDAINNDPAGLELRYYVNGALKWTSGDIVSFDRANLEQYAYELARSDVTASLPEGSPMTFVFGNSPAYNRPFRGTIDDLRFYGTALTDEQVAALYRLPTAVSAGTDFSVAGADAELHGSVGTRSEGGMAPGVTGDLTWTLVSAPDGAAADVSIANAASAVTAVTLPVVGEYVFRMTSGKNGIGAVSEVTVTRLAEPVDTAPTVETCTASPCELSAVAKATVTDQSARVKWTKVSGPGAAWFVDVTATETLVEFSAAGTYVLRVTASNDAGADTETVAVTVGGKALSTRIAEEMRAHWPLTNSSATAGNAQQKDLVNGFTLTPAKGYPDSHWLPCVNGMYTWTLADQEGLKTLYTTDYQLVPPEGGYGNVPPANEWETVSMWMYHEGGRLVPVNYVGLMNCNASHAFMYRPNGGLSTDFELMQIPNGSGKELTMRCRFQGPNANFTNRWVHVLAQINCQATADSEVWVDGHRLEPCSGYSARLEAQRAVNSKYVFGGSEAEGLPSYVNDAGAKVETDKNRGFPGALSDIRIYNRHLDEAEIRYLAAYPRGDENRAPDVTLGVTELRGTVGRPLSVATAVTDDGRPADGALVWRWEVTAGDGSKLSIDDADPAVTEIVGLRKSQGGYTLRLVATDGDRTTYSAPLSLLLDPTGLLILFR